MGKRKLHNNTYFQCDWTGLPMRQTNCYMPDWNESGRLLKHGSYACWEAVVAHAQEELGADDPKMKKIQEHVDDLVGCAVKSAPHWSQLAWFARGEKEDVVNSPTEFLDVCRKQEGLVVAVRIMADGSAHEVFCDTKCITDKFETHLTRPFSLMGPMHGPQSFQTVRKKGNKDRDLTVFYWPFKNGLPFNAVASNAFKMQIYGDALLVNQTKEPCFMPRERFVNYFIGNYNEQFSAKNKRKEPPQATLSTDDYALAKAEMATELQSLEAVSSANASLPADLAKAAVLPPPLGKELVALLAARGQSPPPSLLQHRLEEAARFESPPPKMARRAVLAEA